VRDALSILFPDHTGQHSFLEEILQQTLVIIKPDGVQRGLVGKILARFEERGLKIVALKMVQVNRELAEKHYAVHKGKFFYDGLVNYIVSSPVVAMVLEGHEAIGAVRAMVGATRPWEAAAGTIRGDYAMMGLRNLIHASDAPETAKNEIALWFNIEQVNAYPREIDRWINE
jgi:nucleoside-diphosphate kinase